MRVLLDEKPFDARPAMSVNDAVSAAAAVARRHGRVIVDVFVDGARWSSDHLSSPSADAIADEIRLYSAEPHELVRQTLMEASTALQQADALQREAATLLQADQPQPAMAQLGEAVSIWLSVQQAVRDGTSLLDVDLDQLRIDGQPLRAMIERLSDHLTTLRNALVAEDPIGISDTLLYEMPDVVEQWRTMLEELQGMVGGGARRREDTL